MNNGLRIKATSATIFKHLPIRDAIKCIKGGMNVPLYPPIEYNNCKLC